MYEFSDKTKYIVASFTVLILILVILIFYNNRKNVFEYFDATTTEAVKNMASVFNQDAMVIKKLQTTDTLNVGTDATVARTLSTTNLTVNKDLNATETRTSNLTVTGNLVVPKMNTLTTFYDTGTITPNIGLYTSTDYKTLIPNITITWSRIGNMMFASVPEMSGYPNSGTTATTAGMPLLMGLPLAVQLQPTIDKQPQMVYGSHDNRNQRELFAAVVSKNINIRGSNQFGVYYTFTFASNAGYVGQTVNMELNSKWPSNPVRIYPHTLSWTIA